MERSGLKYVEFSENQKGILVLSQMEEANAAYNLPGVMVLEGELDNPKLEKALHYYPAPRITQDFFYNE